MNPYREIAEKMPAFPVPWNYMAYAAGPALVAGFFGGLLYADHNYKTSLAERPAAATACADTVIHGYGEAAISCKHPDQVLTVDRDWAQCRCKK